MTRIASIPPIVTASDPIVTQQLKGNTIEKFLQAICNAQKTINHTNSVFLNSLHQIIENVRKLTANEKALKKHEAFGDIAFGVAEGASLALLGVAPFISGANTPMTNAIQTTCQAAAPIFKKGGEAFSTYSRGHQGEVEMRRSLAQSVDLQRNQGSTSSLDSHGNTLDNAARRILEANSRGG